MTKFLVRRLISGIIIVILGMLVVYTVIRCLPASYVENQARQLSSRPGALPYKEMLDRLNSLFGLDVSIIEGYIKWLGNAMRGDWGNSWQYTKPVGEKFADVVWWSVLMNAITFILEFAICIPIGILAARKQYSKTDYAITIIALACISLPSFFLGTLLKYIFSVKLGWLPSVYLKGAMYEHLSIFGKIGDLARHLALPVITLTMLSVGGLTRYTRTNMLEVLGSDYIRTARAKGLSERVVINKHAFRNTLIPLVTYMSYLLPSMFSGAMITEQIFEIPGIGQVAYQAMVNGDIPFTMFYLFFVDVLTQVSLILADIMYAAVDPRVRVE